MHHADLCADPINPAAALDAFTQMASGAGAIVSFTGLVRGDEGVTALTLEAHPRVTLTSMQAIVDAAADRFAVTHSIALHRHGTMCVGEVVVFVAADWIMNRLKTEAVFWKKEHRPGGDRWIEPTDADYAALKDT